MDKISEFSISRWFPGCGYRYFDKALIILERTMFYTCFLWKRYISFVSSMFYDLIVSSIYKCGQ